MRILMVTSEYPPYSWGGLGTYSFNVAKELRKKNVIVDVLLVRSYDIYRRNQNQHIHTSIKADFSLNKKDIIKYITKFKTFKSYLLQKINNCLRNSVLKNQYDVMYSIDYHVTPISVILYNFYKIAGRHICSIHLPAYSGFTYQNRALTREQQMITEHHLIRNCDAVVVPSEFTKSVLTSVYGISDNQIYVIPLGVKPGTMMPIPRNKRSIDIITVARATEQKGLNYFVDVVSLLANKESRLVNKVYLVSSGPLIRYVKKLIKRRSLEKVVKIVSNIPYPRLISFLSHSLIYLSTSVYETFGLSILEAMAQGTPIVGYAVGAIPEIVMDGSEGFLIKGFDNTKICEYIYLLLVNNNIWNTLSLNAYKKAKKYSWKRHVKKLIQVFQNELPR